MTDIPLRDYIERRLTDLETRLVERLSMNDIAVGKAERTLSERLASMNEFRDALRDQSNKMATRLEVEKLNEEVQELRRAKANFDGRLLMLSAVVSGLVTVALWAMSRVWTP